MKKRKEIPLKKYVLYITINGETYAVMDSLKESDCYKWWNEYTDHYYDMYEDDERDIIPLREVTHEIKEELMEVWDDE